MNSNIFNYLVQKAEVFSVFHNQLTYLQMLIWAFCDMIKKCSTCFFELFTVVADLKKHFI